MYSISVNKNRKLIPVYNEYLSIDEQEKASRFKFIIDQERFIISRAILRILSGSFLKEDPKQIKFDYGEYGKPSYASNQNLKFNLSHSGDVIVIGFAESQEIGIDVEFIKTDFEVLKLAQKFFSKTEIIALENQPAEDLNRAFFRCWTRKESFIKAEGSGLSFPLDQFAVSLENDHQSELLVTNWDYQEKSQWLLFSFIPSNEYIGAIAVKKKSAQIAYHDWYSLIT
ncbi:MAG: 4'-phosphopantetheinyl transferase superfamily protein [Maribacter sp.]